MHTHSKQTREALRAAACWLALLESGRASPSDLERLAQWRGSNSEHEQAWQKAQQLRQRFSQLPPELAMATLDRPQASRRALLKQALGLAALAPAAWLLSRQLPLEAWTADVHTAVGERRRLVLSDGTVLQLNTDSAVDLNLEGASVKLLRGEVALAVPQGRNQVLQQPYGQVVISGADVCLHLFEQACRVSVVKGQATVYPLSGGAVVLQAGQQTDVRADGPGRVAALDDLLLGWREGVLRLNDRPLGDLLNELRRYRPGVLRWDPELERLRVTGTFRLDDTDRVLALLAASLPLHVQTHTRYWVSLTAPEIRG
ncbi:FecR domain-containing protein [Pseudomonas promysalinigenes]|uniref:FecR domain-containing protein n=1 Tax=Pseudomonas promysalinigenes TaxID=485898 RepID=UPI00164516C3|nr:FecR domain-containing protein [Pseudomonas promysalinigenes]QXI35556.1 DUF4880 domain-containing protein [Pseudomonas promysalinigenes]